MELNPTKIQSLISKIAFVKIIEDLNKGDFFITGKFEVILNELDSPLEFELQIAPQYPLRTYENESIKFINKNLMPYNHVMEDGSICIHTSHSTRLDQKLYSDFISLKNWIYRYYINQENDRHYEHLIQKEKTVDDQYYAYIFTDLENSFLKGEFGTVQLSFLNSGSYKEKVANNFLVQSFNSSKRVIKRSEWSETYKRLPLDHEGIYLFIDTPPAINNRFAISNWKEISDHLDQEFLNYLSDFQKKHIKSNNGKIIPLFIGYNIPESNVHWLAVLLKIGDFPIDNKLKKKKSGLFLPEFSMKHIPINWAITRNSSYKYFFGRGKFSDLLTEKKILIIGIGAIGSIVAKTLTRGGCKHIDFIDYDIKEPENICRSEYLFQTGIINKTDELNYILSLISPFLNSNRFDGNYFEKVTKFLRLDQKYINQLSSDLCKYDFIFDCSTDNDLMFILDSLDINTTMINLSITNHAKNLVCAFNPNIYHFVMNQFNHVLANDTEDLYNPTGCWNPTFKASYNDINSLVQIALKSINKKIETGSILHNFIVGEDENMQVKIVEY